MMCSVVLMVSPHRSNYKNNNNRYHNFLGLAGSSEGKIRKMKIRFGNNISMCSSSSSAIRSSSPSSSYSSEERVYDAVMKQAAMAEENRKRDLHHDFFKNEDLLKVAYDRCGQICSEYAKTFYLGT